MFTSIVQLLGTAATAYGVLAACPCSRRPRRCVRQLLRGLWGFFASFAGGYGIWLLYGLSAGPLSSSSSPMISALSRGGVVVARTAASTRGLACSVRT
jgi:hypothetical protein